MMRVFFEKQVARRAMMWREGHTGAGPVLHRAENGEPLSVSEQG